MKRILLAALAAAAIPLSAQAGDLDYTFVQGGYYNDFNSGADSHGWSGSGQFAVGQNFFLSGGAGRTEIDGQPNHFDGGQVGGGFHVPISAQTDFIGELQYGRETSSAVSGHATTYTGDVGVRSALAPHFEGWVKAGYTNASSDFGGVDEGSRGRVFGNLGGEYKFNKNVGLVSEVTFVRDEQQVFVGPRINF